MGKLKQKGVYHFPDPLDYAASISTMSPPGWHRDWSATVVQESAVAAMVHNVPPETFVHACTNPYAFCLRAKVDRSSRLYLGDREMQRTTRYYVARQGSELIKISPPAAGGVIGQWKRANGVTKAEYDRVMTETGGAWDERVCTKNQSKYTERRTAFQAGYAIAECNDAASFRFDNLNYDWYIGEARKLIIG